MRSFLVVAALCLFSPSWALAQDGGQRAADGGVVDSPRSFDAGTTYERLALDYNCPAAPAPVDLGDAGWLYPPARVLRTNCMIAGATAEAFRWRDLADAGVVGPKASSQVSWIITTALCTASAIFTGYANNRTARHLPLWPP